MLSATEYVQYAMTAVDDCEDYLNQAEAEKEPRRSALLKSAQHRIEDAEFYLSRAEIIEASAPDIAA